METIDDDFLIDLVANNKWTDMCIQIVMRIIHKLHGRLRLVFIVTANPYGLIRFSVAYTISKKALLILHFNGRDLIDMKLCELKICARKLLLSIQDVALRRKGLMNVCYKNESTYSLVGKNNEDKIPFRYHFSWSKWTLSTSEIRRF